MLKSKRSSISSKTSQALNQASSPLIQRKQYVGDVYSSLTYLRKSAATNLHDGNIKKENNKNESNLPLKRKRIKFVETEPREKNPTPFLSPSFMQISKVKIHVDQQVKEKKHFHCPYNPELLIHSNQGVQPINSSVCLSKYRKIAQDFVEGIDLDKSKVGKQQKKVKKVGKRGQYQYDLFKQSDEIGRTQAKLSTRKIFLTRTRSSIEFV